jgi:hypothetical protein
MPETDPLDHLPPWLFLLTPLQRGWRESQILKGRDPDSHILQQLIEAGKWSQEENDA